MGGKFTDRCSIALACNLLGFRDAMRRLLAPEPDFEIVTEADDLGQLSGLVGRSRPEVVLSYFSPTDQRVAAALQSVATSWIETRVVALVQSEAERRPLLRRAFVGDVFVLQHVTIPEIVDSIREGRKMPRNSRVGVGEEAGPVEPRLTPRERQVVSMLTQGFRTREIAAALAIRESTIHVYVHRLLKKYGASRRIDLVLGAVLPDLKPHPISRLRQAD